MAAILIHICDNSLQFQIRIFWKRLAWPDLEVAFTFATNIISVSKVVPIVHESKCFLNICVSCNKFRGNLKVKGFKMHIPKKRNILCKEKNKLKTELGVIWTEEGYYCIVSLDN